MTQCRLAPQPALGSKLRPSSSASQGCVIDGELARLDWLAAGLAADLGDEHFAADVMDEVDLGHGVLAVGIAPAFEHQDDLSEVSALLSEFIPGQPTFLGRARLQDAGIGEPPKPRSQDVSGGSDVSQDVGVARGAEGHGSHDMQGPPVVDRVQGDGQGVALWFGFQTNGGMLRFV
jgi:hypothetical protein